VTKGQKVLHCTAARTPGTGRGPCPAWRWMVTKHRETISLVDEQGNAHEFSIVDVIEVAEQRYAILQPAEGGKEAVVFRVEDDESLTTVEDDAEFERVAEAVSDLEEYDAVEFGEEPGDDEDDEEDEDNGQDEDDDAEDDAADGRAEE